MKKSLLITLSAVLLASLAGFAAAQTPTPSPTHKHKKAAMAEPTPAPTVQASGNANTYETFILKKEGRNRLQIFPDITDGEVKLVKPTDDDMVLANKELDKWKDHLEHAEFSLGLGGAPDISNDLCRTYTPAFTFNFAFGYRFSPQFSLLLDFDGGVFGLNHEPSDGDQTLLNFNLALLAKLRLSPTGVRPYLFAGPGLGIYNLNFRFSYNGLEGNDSLQDANFMAEGGLGVEIPLAHFIDLYLQSRAVVQFTNSNFVAVSGIDNETVYLPIEVGITFAK